MLKLLLSRIVSQPYSALLPAPLYEILGGALSIIQTSSNHGTGCGSTNLTGSTVSQW